MEFKEEIPNILYNGDLNLSFGRTQATKKWKNKTEQWSDFLMMLADPITTHVTQEEYKKLPKAEQGKIKDVGAYVAGFLKEGKRTADHVQSRSLLTLDADHAGLDFWDDVQLLFENAAAIHTTHSHTDEKPRYRLLIPLKRAVTVEEYEPIARKIAEMFGMDNFDDTTYQVERLMHKPAHAKDGAYFYDYLDLPWLDPDEILNLYEDWRDSSYWPESSRSHGIRERLAKKQGDPLEKPGWIGAFCRTYDIVGAIETFLPEVYASTGKDDRYTYLEGSTAGGLVLYDDKFAYSHHSTDPVGDKLVNSFDLVRIHKFGDLDIGKENIQEVTKLPSYQAMMDFVSEDKLTQNTRITEDFGDEFEGEKHPEWLSITPKGKPVINTHILAEEIISEYAMIRTNVVIDGAVYNKKTGTWSLKNSKAFLNKIIGEKLGSFSSVHYKRETLDKIWDRIYITENYDPFDSEKKPELVAFKNGTYDIHNGKLREHRPEDYIIHEHSFDIDVDKSKTAYLTKQWIEFLSPGSLQFIMELIGSCFYTKLPIQAITFFKGGGSNGKSTFLNYVKQLIGEGNYSSVSLKQLTGRDSRFLTSKLHHSLVNVVADIPADFIEDTGLLKNVTGDDSLTGEFKGVDAFSFAPYATMVFSCNFLPTFSDTSFGWERRLYIVPFVKTGLRSNEEFKKKFAMEKLIQEIPIFIRECCEAFNKLLNSNSEGFYMSEAMKQEKETWLLNNDNIKKFYQDCLVKVIAPKHGESTTELYQLFVSWCSATGIRNVPKEETFKRRILEISGESETHRSRPWDNPKLGRIITRYPYIYRIPQAKKIDREGKLTIRKGVDVQNLENDPIFDAHLFLE